MLPALLVASFLAGLAAQALGWLGHNDGPLIAVGIALAVACIATARRPVLVWFGAAAVSSACWGALLAPEPLHRGAYRAPQGGLARITIEVSRGGCGQTGCWSEARLLGCVELAPRSCAPPGERLGVSSGQELPLGARVTALASLKLRGEFRNPTGATFWPDLRPPLYAKLREGASPRIDEISTLDATLSRARGAIRDALSRSLAPPHAGIARALLLGEGSAVDRPLNESIRNAGVSHVLAVSGMHVTLLVGALVAFVRYVWLCSPLALHWEARRAAAVLGVLLAPLIARLCGAAPSAVRAAWTSTLMYLVVALGLRPCALSVSALVVGVHATLTPHDALHPGFVLSVLATAGLLTHQSRRETSAVLKVFLESARAWLATAPFLLLCFSQTSLVAVLANVALLPVGAALVPLAATHCTAAVLNLYRELPTAALFQLASGAFVETARFCASLDPAIALPPITAVEVVAACVLAASFMVPVGPRARALLAVGALVAVAASEWALRRELAPGELRVTYLDVGQGDGAIIETGAGRTALIDAGGRIGGGPDPGQQAVLPVLRARRVTRIDVVVLSHPHPDHYGGLAAVLEAMPVGELWDTGQAEAEGASGEVTRLLARARELGVRVRGPAELCRGTQRLGAARLRVMAPCPAHDETLGANDNSFVIKLEHGRRSFLFTGDIEREAEAKLVSSRLPLDADVLKVPHHGSRTSSSAPLLARVQPWLAVISAGPANRFGHPHEEVLKRLEGVAAHVLRTDELGGVEVWSDGGVLRVSAWDDAVHLRLTETAPRAPRKRALLPESGHHEGHARNRAQHQHPAGQPQGAR